MKKEKEKTEEEKQLDAIVEKLGKIETVSQEEIDILIKLNAQKEAQETIAVPQRRIFFSDDRSPQKIRTIREIMNLPSRLLTEEETEVQSFCDDAYILSTCLKCDPRELKMWQNLETDRSALKKAMDSTTAGEGDEWVPTALSADLIEKFRLESRVAQLFADIPMPTNPYDLPYFSGSIDFYLVPESTSDEPSKPQPSTPGTGKRTLTAKKLKARVLFSDEFDEDSLIPVLPQLRSEIILAGSECMDEVVIDGDTTAPHQDSDVTLSTDRRKIFKGLRKLCPAGTKADLSTFDKDTTRGLLTAMAKFGVTPAILTWIAGITVYNKMRGLAELLTVDKYGPSAVILTGEVGRLYGSPIVISEKIRQNLNDLGVYDGSTTDKTILPVVRRDAFLLGSRGQAKLSFLSDDIVDQNQLLLSFRKAFVDKWDTSLSGNTTIALGYKIS